MSTEIAGIPADYKPGLEGVIAGISAIGEIDPNRAHLIYYGYATHELAEKSNFEEVAFLLQHGRLPKKPEFETFVQELKKERSLPTEVLKLSMLDSWRAF